MMGYSAVCLFLWIMMMCYSVVAQAIEGSTMIPISIQSNDNVQEMKVIRTKKSVVTVDYQLDERKGLASSQKDSISDEVLMWQLYQAKKFQELGRAIEKRKHEEKGWQPSSELLQAIRHKDTDERVLWNLYHNKKYSQVYYRIDGLIKKYPGWRPSESLLTSVQAARMDEKDLWMLLNKKRLKEVELAIQKRKKQDVGWHPSKKIMLVLKQMELDERPLWKRYNQGDIEGVKLTVTLLQAKYPDWKPESELWQAMYPVKSQVKVLSETTIWNLIHQQKYEQALLAIKKLQIERMKLTPSVDWKPSSDMKKTLFDGRLDSQIEKAMIHKNWRKIIKLSRDYSQGFDCAHDYRRLVLSEAFVYLERFQEAVAVYDQSVQQCEIAVKMNVIEHALDSLPVAYLHSLFKTFMDQKGNEFIAKRKVIARYRYILKKGVEKKDLPVLLKDEAIIFQADRGLTESLAWNYFTLKEYKHALNLFRKLRKDTKSDELLLGEILVLDRLDDMKGLKGLITTYHDRLKQVDMLEDLLPLLVKACSAESNETCKIMSLKELETYRPLAQGELEMLAWGLYNIEHYKEALDRFSALYQHKQSKNIATGVYISGYKANKVDDVLLLASIYHGPLSQEFSSKIAENLYQRTQFHAAFSVDSENPKALMRNMDSTWVRAGYWMSNNRMPILTSIVLQLNQKHEVLKGVEYLNHGSDALTVEIDRVFLDAGSPIIPPGDLLGTQTLIPLVIPVPQYSIDTKLQGYEWKIGYEHEGWRSWFIHIGQGFVGGKTPASVKGDLGIVNQLSGGFLGIKAYREPIRDFLLTYAGLQDPFSPQSWGKVMRNGLEISGYQNFSAIDAMGLSYKFNEELITGYHVKTNSHVSLDLTVPYTLKYENMNVSIGPNIRWERYENNQMHWTFGHGGYFSPQHWLAWGVSALLISKEGVNNSFRVFSSTGFQVFTQDQSVVLPLSGTGGLYPAAKVKNKYGTLDVQFLHQVNNYFHIELGLKSTRSELSVLGRNTFFATSEGYVFATWYFDKREATYSTDLEGFRKNSSF